MSFALMGFCGMGREFFILFLRLEFFHSIGICVKV